MTWLEIRPRDVWLFRDGKPFSAGQDHSAHSMFPPTPLTIQGALRQKISVSLGVSLAAYKAASRGDNATTQAHQAVSHIGKHGELMDLGLFGMAGPFICLHMGDGIMPMFPVPADLLKHDDTDEFFITGPGATFTSDLEENCQFPGVKEGYENLPGYWMTADAFQNYLDRKVPDKSAFFDKNDPIENRDSAQPLTLRDLYREGKRVWNPNWIYRNENRFGVSTNSATSFRDEGLLYQVQFVRPGKDVGLLVYVDDAIPTHLLEGTINLGGEQRQANATPVNNVAVPARPEFLSGNFKIVFLTPTYFTDGWQPINGDWSGVFGYRVTLKSAVLYRPLKIGGWNSATGTARPMHNYVAPGSVYYFEAEEPFPSPYALTQDPDNINAKALGFGQYATGVWSST